MPADTAAVTSAAAETITTAASVPQKRNTDELSREHKTGKRKKRHRSYIYSFDNLRVFCLILLIFAAFRFPFEALNRAQPFFHIADGLLFTMYGFLVLRDDHSLSKNIRHALRVFLITFAVYLPLTVGYRYLLGEPLFALFTKEKILNFLLLNRWFQDFGSPIWYVQSVLYALIIFRVLRKLRKLDWLFCIVLFAVAALTGEFSDLFRFSVPGSAFVSANLLTCTIPYMLLGRLIYKHYSKLSRITPLGLWSILILGALITAAEAILLKMSGHLVSETRFLGFIPISLAVCMLALNDQNGYKCSHLRNYSSRMYRGMFFVYNPFGYFLGVLMTKIRIRYPIDFYSDFIGVLTVLACYFGFLVYAALYRNRQRIKKDRLASSLSSSEENGHTKQEKSRRRRGFSGQTRESGDEATELLNRFVKEVRQEQEGNGHTRPAASESHSEKADGELHGQRHGRRKHRRRIEVVKISNEELYQLDGKSPVTQKEETQADDDLHLAIERFADTDRYLQQEHQYHEHLYGPRNPSARDSEAPQNTSQEHHTSKRHHRHRSRRSSDLFGLFIEPRHEWHHERNYHQYVQTEYDDYDD